MAKGLFDDLIPAEQDISGAFDDTVPAEQSLAGAFDDLVPERPGHISNVARKVGERSAGLLGNLSGFLGTAVEGAESAMAQLGGGFNPGVVYGDPQSLRQSGYDPDITLGDFAIDFTSRAKPEHTELGFNTVDQMLSNVDLGYREDFTWDRLKAEPSIGNILGFISEQGIGSAPDMAAAATNLPLYILSRAQETGEERARNDGRAVATPEDVVLGTPSAALSSTLERIGARGILPEGAVIDGIGSLAGAVGKATAKEAGTEFLQENIDYAGESVGTQKGYDPMVGIERGAAGAVAGAGIGAGGRTATGSYELTRNLVAKLNNKPVEAVTDEDIQATDPDAILAEAQREGLPLDQVIAELTGTNRPEASRDPRQRRERAKGLRDTFNQPTVMRREDIDPATGEMREGAQPVTEPVTGTAVDADRLATRRQAYSVAQEIAGGMPDAELLSTVESYLRAGEDPRSIIRAFDRGHAAREGKLRDVPDARPARGPFRPAEQRPAPLMPEEQVSAGTDRRTNTDLRDELDAIEDPVELRRRVREARQKSAELERKAQEAEKFAGTDELTQMPNRRAYNASPEQPVQAIMDMDNFKAINDQQGHAAGDAAIKEVAEALKAEGLDAYRLGGDEFVVQGADRESVKAGLERVRARLAESKIQDGGLKLSYGIAELNGRSRSDALHEADLNLKADKAARKAAGLRTDRKEDVEAEGVTDVTPERIGEMEGVTDGAQGVTDVTPETAPETEVDTNAEAAGVEALTDNLAANDIPESRLAAIDARVDALTIEQLKRAAEINGYRGNADRIAEQIKQEHPDDAEAVLDQVEGSNRGTDAQTDAKQREDDITLMHAGIPADRLAKWAAKETKPFFEEVAAVFRDVTAALRGKESGTRQGVAAKLFRAMLYSTHSEVRSLANRFPESKTLRDIVDRFGAMPGEAAKYSTDLLTAATTHATKRMNQLGDILADADKHGIDMKQVVAMVRNPGAMRGKVGELAKRVQKLLKDELEYMRAAGVDIGEIKDGYFPRIYDREKMLAQQADFIAKATEMYAAMGEAEPRRKAEAFWYRKVYGDEGRPGEQRGNAKEAFSKERQLDQNAEKYLSAYLDDNAGSVLSSYFMQSSRRAEIARRFGDRWSEWPALERQMRKEGVSEEAIEFVRNSAEVMTGLKDYGMNGKTLSALSWLRTWGTLGLLEKSTLTSLGELWMPSVRAAGDMKVAADNVRQVMESSLRSLLRLPANERMQSMREFAQDIGEVAGSMMGRIMSDRWAGGDVEGARQAESIDSFFRRIGLTQLTDYNVVLALNSGEIFIRRLANDIVNNRSTAKSSALLLREFGVPAGKEAGFAKFVQSLNGKLPDPNSTDPQHLQMIEAMRKFARQSVMRPDKASRPRYANHPVGAVLFQLQSFTAAFQKNVINRQGRLIKQAVTEKGLSAQDRLRLAAGFLPGAGLVFLTQALVGEARDELFSPDVEKTTGAKIETAVARSGWMGQIEPFVQLVSGSRYNRSIWDHVAGPTLGGIGDVSEAVITVATNNSENTNTAERSAVREMYDGLLEPAINVFMRKYGAGPIASTITTVGLPAGRDPAMDAIAGEQEKRNRKPRQSVVEMLISDDKPKSGRSGRAGRSGRTGREGRGGR